MTLTPQQQLLDAIAAQAPNSVVHAALLVGSYGESGWNSQAVSPPAHTVRSSSHLPAITAPAQKSELPRCNVSLCSLLPLATQLP